MTNRSGHVLKGLPALAARTIRVLVVGSMPGAMSLRTGEYYAHPRNRFWLIMESLFGIPRASSYRERTAGLEAEGVGLWDVLKNCERDGSLDSRIATPSEQANDFNRFLRSHGRVERIVFNGRKAEQSFCKLVRPGLEPSIAGRIQLITAPSTSPANAAVTSAQIVRTWGKALLEGAGDHRLSSSLKCNDDSGGQG